MATSSPSTPWTIPPWSPSPTTTYTMPGVCRDPEWKRDTAYSGGAKVSYQAHRYHARWWNLNEEPTMNSPWGVWVNDGPCAPTQTPTP
ncbi:carbohydrate-binding protein [Kitasatospora sp. NPDC057500]|uniref:carbohydrate-binding protein n=1 Tax=Kitasatospora sp. NPDC057500 TaxID=3346151 RepID=UPI0036A2437C